jgi:hypothetical protein
MLPVSSTATGRSLAPLLEVGAERHLDLGPADHRCGHIGGIDIGAGRAAGVDHAGRDRVRCAGVGIEPVVGEDRERGRRGVLAHTRYIVEGVRQVVGAVDANRDGC